MRIIAGEKNFGIPVGLVVEHEVGFFLVVRVIAEIMEQALAKASTADGAQILLGNDLVGIDIDHR